MKKEMPHQLSCPFSGKCYEPSSSVRHPQWTIFWRVLFLRVTSLWCPSIMAKIWLSFHSVH